MNGFLVVDKPGGMTSHDVVNRIRRITNEKSVGHLGTLDPMATGVLPLLLGKWTRLAQFFGKMDKSYTGTIRFGFATDTYDAEGQQSASISRCIWMRRTWPHASQVSSARRNRCLRRSAQRRSQESQPIRLPGQEACRPEGSSGHCPSLCDHEGQ